VRSSRRWQPTRFGERASGQGAASGFSPPAALFGGAVVMAVLLGFLWSAVAGPATPASHPRIFGGSIVLDDNRPLVVLDLATGDVTVRLSDVFAQVGAPTYADVSAVPLDTGTLLLNRSSGSFNLLGKDNFVLERTGGGVGLGSPAGITGATGIADGDSAYIVRQAPHATVSLVGADTVAAAAQAGPVPGTGPQRGSPVTVAPRGFATLAGSVAGRPGAEAAAGGDLYALVATGTQSSVVELRPNPAGPDGLTAENRGAAGRPGAPAALEAAPAIGVTSSAAPAEVALATPGLVRLYPPATRAGAHRDVAVPATQDATAILPVSGAHGSVWFVAQTHSAWSLFGVDPAGRVSGPHVLVGVPAGAPLATPALSAGRIYTMARNTASPTSAPQPALWSIDTASGAVATVAGEARYPRDSPSERASFASTQVVADGPRVIFDNPDSLLGVVVFTDGSHPPTTFDKSTAVTISATGALAVASGATGGPGKPKTTPGHGAATTVPPVSPPAAAPQVSAQVVCADTTQTPRAPQITSAIPSAHSVLVSWSYPLLDEQDCEPDSWAVRVRALQGPQPAQPVRAESGQLQYGFAGLRPNDIYQVTVTAYIRNQSTPSAPVDFTTTATGPDPPVSVTTTSDGNGNWIVSWVPCTAADCYVPADAWVVTATTCGSFVGTPPSVQVTGSQTSVVVPAGDLLGASLSFSVHGVTASGISGDPTRDRSCAESWRPPDPSHISVKASAVPSGATVAATVEVSADEDPVQAYGSAATEFTYQVGTATVGPTTATTATITGLAPGRSYQPTVTVAPRDQPQASVTVTGQPFTRTLPWPATLALRAAANVDPANPNAGNVIASFTGVPPVSLAAAGQLTCGSVGIPEGGVLDPTGHLSLPIDLTKLGGNCNLTLSLTETSTRDYGVASRALSAGFSVGTLVDQNTFTVTYGFPGLLQLSAVVNGQTLGEGVNWAIVVSSPPSCTGVSQSSAGAPQVPVTLDLSGCDSAILPSPVTVTVSYTYLGTQISFDVVNSSTPPTTTTTTTIAPTTTTTATTTTTTLAPTTTSVTTAPTTGAVGLSSPSTALAGASTPLAGGGGSGRPVVDVIMAASALALVTGRLCGRTRKRRRDDTR
jgi:hypothetical protein